MPREGDCHRAGFCAGVAFEAFVVVAGGFAVERLVRVVAGYAGQAFIPRGAPAFALLEAVWLETHDRLIGLRASGKACVGEGTVAGTAGVDRF